MSGNDDWQEPPRRDDVLAARADLAQALGERDAARARAYAAEHRSEQFLIQRDELIKTIQAIARNDIPDGDDPWRAARNALEKWGCSNEDD